MKNKFIILDAKQKKRLYKNIISGFTSEGFKVLAQVLFAPLMILVWGAENFGIWILLLSIPNMFTIFNLNTLDASIQEITIHRSHKDIKMANKIFQNSIALIFMNLIIISIIIFIFYIFNTLDLKILNFLNPVELKLIFILLILSIYINLLEGIFLSGIYSIGKLYVGFNIAGFIDILSKSLIVVSGIFFEDLIYPVIIFFIFTVIKFILNCYFFNYYSKELKISFKLVSKKIIKKLIKLSIGHTSDIMTSIMRHSSIIIILSIYFDPYIIGYVATVKTLFYFLPVRFFGKLSHISLYEYATLYSKRSYHVIKKNVINSTKLVVILLLLFFSFSLALGPYVYKIWLSNKFELEILFLILIALDASLFTFREFAISFLRSINKYTLLGVSELVIITFSVVMFYFSLYLNQDYIFAFLILTIGSLISLIFGIFILFLFMKKLK